MTIIRCAALFLALLGSSSTTVVAEPYKITIISAEYSDGAGATCSPDLAICNGRALCEFTVSDDLCSLGDSAGPARNLEVHYACGVPLPDKAAAAAKGTKITLDCSQ